MSVRDNVLTCISDISGDFSKKAFRDVAHDALKSLCEAVGMKTFIFAYSFQESLLAPVHHVITNAPDWMKHYSEHNLQRDDPVVKYLIENSTPVLWSDLAERREYSSGAQAEVLRQANEFGLRYGVSMPCRAQNCLGVLSFADEDKGVMEASRELMLYGPVLTNHLMDTLRRVHQTQTAGEPAPKDILTAREIDCLYWASEGKTAWEIGKILSISERTVVFHLTNVVTKLDSSSRQHAISKAILLGILPPRF